MSSLPSPASRRRTVRWPDALRPRRGLGAVWALNAALLGVAVLLAFALRGVEAPATGGHIPWPVLAAGFAAAEACVLHVHIRRHRYSIALGELPLVLGLLFTTPLAATSAWVAGSAIVVVLQRMPPVRIAFNLLQFALTALVACVVVHVLGGGGAAATGLWLAAWAGVVLSAASASPLVLAAMALSGERLTLRDALSALRSDVATAGITGSFGLAAASVLRADPWSLAFLLPPAAALYAAYRAFQSERTKHGQLEFLYAAVQTLTRAGDPETGLAGMLASANEQFRSELSQVCVFGAGGAGFSVTVGPGTRVLRGGPLDDGPAADLTQLFHENGLGPRVIGPQDVGPDLAAHMRATGMTGAMVAPLAGRDMAGAVFVANRLGADAFSAADLQLLSTLADHCGPVVGQDRLGRHIQELRVTQRELEHQAFHDALTGLANRLLFADRVRHALARRDGSAAVLYIDLDDFKPINDTLGHEAGDDFLRAVGDRLRATLRAADTPARLGGDEFAVLLVDVSPDEARIVGERILAAFAEPVELTGGTRRPIHASMGIATADAGAMDGDQLIRNADAAMYASKHGGKRGMSVYGLAA